MAFGVTFLNCSSPIVRTPLPFIWTNNGSDATSRINIRTSKGLTSVPVATSVHVTAMRKSLSLRNCRIKALLSPTE